MRHPTKFSNKEKRKKRIPLDSLGYGSDRRGGYHISNIPSGYKWTLPYSSTIRFLHLILVVPINQCLPFKKEEEEEEEEHEPWTQQVPTSLASSQPSGDRRHLESCYCTLPFFFGGGPVFAVNALCTITSHTLVWISFMIFRERERRGRGIYPGL